MRRVLSPAHKPMPRLLEWACRQTCAIAAGCLLATLSGLSFAQDAVDALSRIDRQEEVYLALEAKMPLLDASLLDLSLPDLHSRELFANAVTVTDLASAALTSATEMAASSSWPMAKTPISKVTDELILWRPFLDRVAYFEHVRFHMVDGRFVDDAETRYLADTRLSAGARLLAGGLAGLSARVDLLWIKQPPNRWGEDDGWRIAEWRTRSFSVLEAPQPLFAEVLDHAIADPATRTRARTSLHQRLATAYLRDPQRKKPHDYFQLYSLNRHPGVAVVDIDRDGHDDLYVMARWGRNMLLRNRGDGRFEDIAPALGLDIENHTSSAVFADFDNDGDTDAFLGRTLAPSRYLVNEDGRFVDRSGDLVSKPLPALVSSVAAADYDGDGLLDIYIATYSIQSKARQDLLPADEVAQIRRLSASGEAHLFRNRVGPVNVLLRNLGGGRFARVPAGHGLDIWRNTFQASWSDYDGDGDPDIYLANDFAPNNLMRNDGNGRFTDVTDRTGTADVGFGMGVTWGDYDFDGRHDLYVTNMYSSAGRRITAQMGAISADIAPMARGNSLFRNLGPRFARVSGLEPPALLVEKAGWGWGSQFLDIDNDGDLDIYALAGYYTAPRRTANPPDL